MFPGWKYHSALLLWIFMKLEIKSESQCYQIRLPHWKIHCRLHFIQLFMYAGFLFTLRVVLDLWHLLPTDTRDLLANPSCKWILWVFENDLSVISDQGCVTMVSLMAMLVPGQLSLQLIIYTRTLFSSFQKVDGKYYRKWLASLRNHLIIIMKSTFVIMKQHFSMMQFSMLYMKGCAWLD